MPMKQITEFEKLIDEAAAVGVCSSEFILRRYNQPENKMVGYRLTMYGPIKEFDGPDAEGVLEKATKFLTAELADLEKENERAN